MASTEETYRIAAKEHLERAQDQFDKGWYYLAHYLSGLAVECHLRAWLRRRTNEWERSHALRLLAEKSQFYGVISTERVSHFSSVFTTADKRWQCNHRYSPEREFFRYMTKIKAESKVRGTRWKESIARTMLDCAYEVIKEGEAKWNRK